MKKQLVWIGVLALLFVPACGDDDEKPPADVNVVEPFTPREAVNQVRLELEDYTNFQYCEKAFPDVCDDFLQQVYVLSRETGEDYRLVYFNNQDKASTPEKYWYVTVEPYGESVTEVGAFEWWIDPNPEKGLQREGEPMWGIPE